MSAPVETIEVARDEAGMRLDRWFRVHFPDITYGHLQKLLRSGQVRVDSKRAQANVRVERRTRHFPLSCQPGVPPLPRQSSPHCRCTAWGVGCG